MHCSMYIDKIDFMRDIAALTVVVGTIIGVAFDGAVRLKSSHCDQKCSGALQIYIKSSVSWEERGEECVVCVCVCGGGGGQNLFHVTRISPPLYPYLPFRRIAI